MGDASLQLGGVVTGALFDDDLCCEASGASGSWGCGRVIPQRHAHRERAGINPHSGRSVRSKLLRVGINSREWL